MTDPIKALYAAPDLDGLEVEVTDEVVKIGVATSRYQISLRRDMVPEIFRYVLITLGLTPSDLIDQGDE